MAHPVRRCLACRTRKAKARLVRLALAESTVVVDPCARRPGRGAYLCPGQECLERALRREGTAVLAALRGRRPGVTLDPESLRQEWRALDARTTREHDGLQKTTARRTVPSGGAAE